MKGKLDHVVPLSELAKAQMTPNNHRWILTATGERGLTNFSEEKSKLDKATGVSGWRIHDLRRSSRSLLSRTGVAPDIAERVLAHKIGGVAGIYDRYADLEEKRDALAKLAALVETIINE